LRPKGVGRAPASTHPRSHPAHAAHSTLSAPKAWSGALDSLSTAESTLAAAHRAHSAGGKPATLGHPLANLTPLRVAEHRHRGDTRHRIVANDHLSQRPQRVALGTKPLDLCLTRRARPWPHRIHPRAQSLAQDAIPFDERTLDRVELRQLPAGEIELASHVDERRDRVATTATAPCAHAAHLNSAHPLCVQRDRHRHRDSENGGTRVDLHHGTNSSEVSPSDPDLDRLWRPIRHPSSLILIPMRMTGPASGR
jgi:hypothetical protein